MYRKLTIISLLLATVVFLSAPNSSSSDDKIVIGADDALLSFEVKGKWETKTKVRGKVIEFTAVNPKDKLILIYYEDRALPYDKAKALNKFLKKYKFEYLPGESLITKTVQGKEKMVDILFALGSGRYKGKKQIIFARSSLIDNTNVVLITLSERDSFKRNFPEMKRLLRYRWDDLSPNP